MLLLASNMTDEAQGTARPASVEDLKLLLRALADNGVEYLLIGGYALYALGYQRGTVDIDIVLPPTLEQGERVRHALLMLPQGVAKDLDLVQSVLGRWVEQARADGGKSKRGSLTTDEKEELARLRKENRVLRVEREILKKAAFFAKENA